MKKNIIFFFLISLTITNSSCIKELFKKKKKKTPTVEVQVAPEAKYFGTWKGSKIAIDQNSNNRIDNDEILNFTGNSELKLNDTKSFTFSLTTSEASINMSGNWIMATNQTSVTITDAVQGSLRFDDRSATEIQTEPIPTASGTVWIIYNKQ
jgi:hypothetical protein